MVPSNDQYFTCDSRYIWTTYNGSDTIDIKFRSKLTSRDGNFNCKVSGK